MTTEATSPMDDPGNDAAPRDPPAAASNATPDCDTALDATDLEALAGGRYTVNDANEGLTDPLTGDLSS